MTAALRLRYVLAFAAWSLSAAVGAAGGPSWTVPGTVRTTWIGNSFDGAGASPQVGRWVQNAIRDIEVSPEGTVVTASGWDENGRCTGLYRDANCNTEKLKQYNGKGGHLAWGWGTASKAAAVWEDEIFLANLNGDLLRFRWTPGELDSAEYVDQVRYCAGTAKEKLSKEARASGILAVGLAARDGRVALLRGNGELVLWQTDDGFRRVGGFGVENARDVALAADGTLWLADGNDVIHATPAGEMLGRIGDAGRPTKVDVAADGRLVVCDTGPRQQVRVYDVSAAPRVMRTRGREGGLRAGVPGTIAPDKLYGLQGANFDAAGNLYVGLCIGPHQGSGTCIRSFAPDGRLRWELYSLAFVDCFCVDPAGDGQVIYGPHEIMTFDADAPPGDHWAPIGISQDEIRYPDDRRSHGGGGTILRRLAGRRLMALLPQMSGGPRLYAFESPEAHIARPGGSFGRKDGRGYGWAWYVDARGDVWNGDPRETPRRRTILRWRFAGWGEDGRPTYDRDAPDAWPWPEGFKAIKRVVYVPEGDTLYVSGYTERVKPVGWGYVGGVLARYDGWTTGKRRKRWQIVLPHDDRKKGPPKAIDVAGNHVFTVHCRPVTLDGRHQRAHLCVAAFGADDGELAGRMWRPERFGPVGIVDMTHGLSAYRRNDGVYMLLVEEVYRAKNLLYLWAPPTGSRSR